MINTSSAARGTKRTHHRLQRLLFWRRENRAVIYWGRDTFGLREINAERTFPTSTSWDNRAVKCLSWLENESLKSTRVYSVHETSPKTQRNISAGRARLLDVTHLWVSDGNQLCNVQSKVVREACINKAHALIRWSERRRFWEGVSSFQHLVSCFPPRSPQNEALVWRKFLTLSLPLSPDFSYLKICFHSGAEIPAVGG